MQIHAIRLQLQPDAIGAAIDQTVETDRARHYHKTLQFLKLKRQGIK